MKLTKAKAKKLCLIKWKYAMETGCDWPDLQDWLDLHHPEVSICQSRCGYCELYDGGCNSEKYGMCPLVKSRTCSDTLDKWGYARSDKVRKKYATIIYNDIKRS